MNLTKPLAVALFASLLSAILQFREKPVETMERAIEKDGSICSVGDFSNEFLQLINSKSGQGKKAHCPRVVSSALRIF